MKLIVDACVFIDAFDPKSGNHPASLRLLETLRERGQPITMPAHGWFEVLCTSKRLIADERFAGPVINGRMDYLVELIHIDADFLKKYGGIDIPYMKAGDHIYVVVALANKYPLVTSDKGMAAGAKQCGVRVLSPDEALQIINSATVAPLPTER